MPNKTTKKVEDPDNTYSLLNEALEEVRRLKKDREFELEFREEQCLRRIREELRSLGCNCRGAFVRLPPEGSLRETLSVNPKRELHYNDCPLALIERLCPRHGNYHD